MTDRKQPHPDAEVVERMERGLPASSKEEEETRAVYQRLIGTIADIELVEPAPGWEDRAVDRWQRESKPAAVTPAPVPPSPWARWRPVAVGLALAALVVVIVVVLRRGAGSGPPELQVAIVHSAPVSRQAEPTVGDGLRASVRGEGPGVELRVYRGQALVARCPGDAGCERAGAMLSIELSFARVGDYQVIGLIAGAALPAPQAAGLEVDVLTAREGGARVLRPELIRVR